MDDSGYTKPVTPTGQYFLEVAFHCYAKSFAFPAMNNCELYLVYIYSLLLISLRNLLYNSL